MIYFMPTWPIRLTDCPEYELDVEAPTRKKAEDIAQILFNNRKMDYFIKNGRRIK